MIYFAERDGLIKIGCSANPRQRCCGLRANLLGVKEGDFSDERALHEQFARYRVEGEWFRDSAPIRNFVEQECGPLGEPTDVEFRFAIPKHLHRQLKALAKAERRRVNQQIVWLVEQAVAAREAKDNNPT